MCIWQSKRPWRTLYRKSQSTPDTLKDIVLDFIPTAFNFCYDKDTTMLIQERRRDKLVIKNGHAVADKAEDAEKVRAKRKF